MKVRLQRTHDYAWRLIREDGSPAACADFATEASARAWAARMGWTVIEG